MRWERNTERSATVNESTWTLGQGTRAGSVLIIPLCRVHLHLTLAQTSTKQTGVGGGAGVVDPVGLVVVFPKGRPRLAVLMDKAFGPDPLTWDRLVAEAPGLDREFRDRLAAAGVERYPGKPLPPGAS